MSELFSAEWGRAFQQAWNAPDGLADALGQAGFTSAIAYGFDDEEEPRMVLEVENGRLVAAEPYSGQMLSWDLRASRETWESWRQAPPSLMALGLAYTQRKLRFKVGDYAAMVRDPMLASPFVKSFALFKQA
jgi:hypothetical protein